MINGQVFITGEEMKMLLRSLWHSLKRWRRIHLGPVALTFKLERSVNVTGNTRSRLRDAWRRDQNWRHSHAAHPADKLPDAPPLPAADEGSKVGIALIVGVGPGFGYATAKCLAKAGMEVVLASRNACRLDALVSEIEAEGGVAFAYGCDATSEASVQELFAHVRSVHGVPDMVVYSIQNFGPGQTIDIEVPAFEDGWRHNCLGSFLIAREGARAMLPLKRGTIVLVGSTSSLLGREGHLNLAVGKFGQRALAQVLARELWPMGIHVAHLIIDADINEGAERPDGGPQSDPKHIADMVLSLHRQPGSAWTSEMDVRPWNEQFWKHC